MSSQDLIMLIRLPGVKHHELTTASFEFRMTIGNRGMCISRAELKPETITVSAAGTSELGQSPVKGFFWAWA